MNWLDQCQQITPEEEEYCLTVMACVDSDPCWCDIFLCQSQHRRPPPPRYGLLNVPGNLYRIIKRIIFRQ